MRVLHVTNGESTAATLRQTSLGGAVLAWNDALHEGPLRPEPLRETRAAFLSACGWGDRESILGGLGHRDRSLAAAGRIVLWFEHDLYDQLQLVEILARVGDPSAVELIDVDAFEGHPDFHGLGELDRDELASLWTLRRPVTGAMVELARRAWAAARAPEPTGLETLLGPDASLPFLGAALGRWLEELPAVGNGLARSERQLLEAIEGGARTRAEVFLAGRKREEAPFEGDAWTWRRLDSLHALVTQRDGAYAVTDEGRAVLAGEADRVEVLGLDRWLGGTHLQPGNVWRWDAREGRITAPDTV